MRYLRCPAAKSILNQTLSLLNGALLVSDDGVMAWIWVMQYKCSTTRTSEPRVQHFSVPLFANDHPVSRSTVPNNSIDSIEWNSAGNFVDCDVQDMNAEWTKKPWTEINITSGPSVGRAHATPWRHERDILALIRITSNSMVPLLRSHKPLLRHTTPQS
ncbi:hypothetical protein P152DRAFT_200340 [Eremomyces bilateralis CBS 781.70]|uniref:Uncharacterized protein n=1 Tax=Eremomyces bilateralis CBS 781.70 TaxID=1392243 RepID=A0A6G1GCY7_9PEZI|nr:uncharacterized protein P152DRAFT_200340 [Eremomyces bilateralis CBS 781.70]KAF1815872.1 hypothetical protein P152DRAFT_200340 [Eremomyces bilateralis CBS 781.70]